MFSRLTITTEQRTLSECGILGVRVNGTDVGVIGEMNIIVTLFEFVKRTKEYM